eukprot:s2131_g3.t1
MSFGMKVHELAREEGHMSPVKAKVGAVGVLIQSRLSELSTSEQALLRRSITMSESSGGEAFVPKELASLVPSFDPAVDSVEIWTSKVELLVTTWPTSKLSELATRLILNCKGTAYQKLQLHRKELLVNEASGIKRLVELVGGTWGQIPLEKKFELTERALYRSNQKPDESSESYLSRCDVVWTELLAKGVTLAEIQAYIVLRGSRIIPDDKKRVIVDSKAEKGGELKMPDVTAAIRMLGSGFFQDYTGARRDKGSKTYDHTAFTTEDEPEHESESFFTQDEVLEDDILEAMAAENDEDTILVMQFEDSISDTIQNDPDLSAYYSTYQEARRRLNERVKVRGFWPVQKRFDKGKGKGKGKFKTKGAFGGGSGALARRIANSFCRICLQKGHWKNECPQRSNPSSGANSTGSTTTAPTSFVVVEEIPPEIAHMAIAEEQDRVRPKPGLSHNVGINKWGKWGKWDKSDFIGKFKASLKRTVRTMKSSESVGGDTARAEQLKSTVPVPTGESTTIPACDALFATTGTIGIVDLGASQTVIGDQQIGDLMQSLPEHVRLQAKRTACSLTFRFGNQQTLNSRHAILLPLGNAFFRIAIVPGKTPFLLSSSFLKGIGAVIDTEAGTLWSKTLQKELPVERSNKNLFLMDLNDLWKSESQESQAQPSYVAGLTCPTESCTKELQPSVSDVEQGERGATGSQVQPGCSLPSSFVKVNRIEMPSDHMPDVENHSEPCVNHAVNAQESFECPSELIVPTSSSHGIGVSEVDSVPRIPEEVRPGDGRCQDRHHESGAVVKGADCLWQSKVESGVPSGVPGPCLDRLVRECIREKSKAGTPALHQVCGETPESGDRSVQAASADQEDPACRSQGERQCRVRNLGSVVRTGHDEGVRSARCDQGAGDRRKNDLYEGGEQESLRPDGQCRDDHARDPEALAESERQNRAVDPEVINAQTVSWPDMDFDFIGPKDSQGYHAMIKRYVQQFTKELDQVKHACQTGNHRMPKLDLLEIMCSEQSELTKQVQRLGGRAQRFGKVQGDLKTPEGRKRMFSVLVTQKPKHVWYSPECGPWCQWSHMNMSKSIAACEAILNKRKDQIWQVALGVVLFRHQHASQAHFDMEQPRGSTLWKTPGMSEIREHTLWNEFDMCRVGDLKDPQTQESIRKRMTVCSTSVDMHVALHGKLCSGEHHHRPIAGNTQVGGKSVKLSQWTELYPQKFARQVAKIIIQDSMNKCPAYVEDSDEHPTKKRRLGMKMSPQTIAARFAMNSQATTGVNWQIALKLADSIAPRVGTQVLESGELVQVVQQLCPEYKIHHLVLCRGTDRYVGPNKSMLPGNAPYRRRACILRKSTEIHVDEDWEQWETLSHRKLRKAGKPARVSLTVFAARQSAQIPTSSASREQSSASADAVNPNGRRPSDSLESEGVDVPTPKRARHDASEVSEPPPVHSQNGPIELQSTDNGPISVNESLSTSSPSETTMSHDQHNPPQQVIELAGQKHGPLFLQLSQEEQAWLLKLHRNLGHPGTAKLTEFCRQLQCPEHFLRAIGDIRCSTCQELRGPTVARPSAIHEACDFGDVVSMDGVVWTNSQGRQFFFYHFLDQSTMFQTAMVAPAHTTEDACRALLFGWFNWAGPPGLLCVDAGTELNSEEFGQFLQKHSVKCRTCAADAHWQNARVERHGGILQVMLAKMDAEQPIETYEQLASALSHATGTKNQWSRYRGYSPELLVFGKGVRVPGSVTSDPSISAHAVAVSNLPEGVRFRQELAVRESARRAFAAVDNDQTMRRAIVQRSRPHRGFFEKGEWVMLWKKKGEADGSWIGPMQVIIQESQQVVSPVHEQPDLEPEIKSSPSETPDGEDRNNTDSNRLAIETPVPETSDEETGLYAEEENCFSLQDQQVYRFEVDINQRDIDHWKEETRPSEMAFLVSAAKRQRSEVKMSTLNAAERKLFEDAKKKEISSWLATETVSKILRHQVPRENILRCRWILTWKEMDATSTPGSSSLPARQVPKARLVVLGFEDPLIDQIPRDSPTMSRLSRVLIMQHAASMKWEIGSFDIKTAFLRGTESSSRTLCMEPPPEMREQTRLSSQEIVRLLRGAYGRVDAPFLWFPELRQSLEKLGFCSAPFDPCTFVLRDSQQRTEGLIGIHVDDGLCCGSPRFHQKLAELEKLYPFGSRKTREFTFTGLKISQKEDYSIWVNQEQYVKDIHPISISKDRKNFPKELVNETERQGLRALVGSLQYAATSTRPDLCSRLGYLQSQINKATVSTLTEANKILHEAKQHSQTTIKIQSIPIEDLRFVAFSDASFASEKTLDSHQGMLIMASHKQIGENASSVVNPIVWHSKKIQKVVVSTLSAEAMSLAGTVDILSWIRLYWAWLRDGNFKWQMADEELLKLPPAFAAIPPTEDAVSTKPPIPVQDTLKQINNKAPDVDGISRCLGRVPWAYKSWKRGGAKEGFYPVYITAGVILAAVVGWGPVILRAPKGRPWERKERTKKRLQSLKSKSTPISRTDAAGEPAAAELTIPNVKDRIDALQYRLSKAAKDRNYMQLEKDMVNRFYEITKSEVKQIEAELLNMDRKMEILERDFRVHIKVHEQKVQNLEYEHKEAKRQVNDTGNNDLQKEREMHSEQLLQMNKEKLDLKRDIRETQLENEGQVKMLIQGFAKRLQNLRDTFEQNHQQLQAQYEEQVEQLKIDLELRRKVEIHEIEERKNQHINELLFNHQEAFDEIKAYYNDITHDNLQLIKSLKDEINEMKEKEKTNKKKMDLLRQENRDLTQPLEDKLEEQRVLEEELKTYTKDKMALKNLKAHYKRLEEQISEAKQEYRACEDKYRKMEKERDDLYKRFKKAVQEIQRKAELGKNVVLEKKLETLSQQFEEKQAQLSEVLSNAKLDPSIVANVTKKLEQVLGAKNRQIKDLQYQVHQATKQYNDTIRVYESKLQSLGVEPEEIGFEAIQTATSLMPARLVTKVS